MDDRWLREAIRLARRGVATDRGGPFGAVVVVGGVVVGRGQNEVTSDLDPTAHAEVQAIRDACQNLGDFRLTGGTLYASCEPCPMCLGAIYWSRLERVVYAASRADAAAVGFDDALIYEEIPKAPQDRRIVMECRLGEEGQAPFADWTAKEGRVDY